MTTCVQCFGVGWVLDARRDQQPVSIEMIPCIYPDCQHSGKEIAILTVDMAKLRIVTRHPSRGFVMSLSPMC